MNTAAAQAKANGLSSVVVFEDETTPREVHREGWMKKVLESVEQKRQFSISTIGLIVAITIALWQIGGSIISAVRGDTKQEMEIQQLKEGMNQLANTQADQGRKFDAMQIQLNEVLTEKKIQDATIKGYKLGQTDGEKGHK